MTSSNKDYHLTNRQTGLTADQVKARVEQGLTNVQIKKLSRSIPQIIADNLLTLFNLINLVIAFFIIWTGSYRNLFFVGPVIFNIVIGSYQAIRSKLVVDKISLVNEQQLPVLRSGQDVQLTVEQLVQDDLVTIKRGNTVPADATVVTSLGLQVNESGLTGETENVAKIVGTDVYSGSIVMAGQALIQLTRVGAQSFVSQLSNAVKQDKPRTSVLMKMINRIIQVLTYTIIPLGLLLFWRTFAKNGQFNDAILGTATSVIGMIPQGLVLLTSIALATGAYNLAKHHILVRSLNAIETLARVDTLCLDKTGTITTGKLTVHQQRPRAGYQRELLAGIATQIVNVTAETNATAQALVALKAKPTQFEVAEALPFSSESKSSGIRLITGETYLLGAPEFILQKINTKLKAEIQTAANQGYRVLGLVKQDYNETTLIGLFLLTDEVRPQAAATFAYLAAQGIDLKIISGDNPLTVANVAQQAGISDSEHQVDLSQLSEPIDYSELVQNNRVFGRVLPQQKAKLIAAMQDLGLTVGMTGDGVNDVLAMRQSDCSVAIAGESDAAEATADFVLLDHNFEAFIEMVNEGRRVINNVERVASLYLIKTIYSVALAVAFIFLGTRYPFELAQLTPINALTVGIPTFFLALEPNYRPPAGRFMHNVMEIATPAAVTNLLALTAIAIVGHFHQLSFLATSTLSVYAIGIVGFCALLTIGRPLSVGKKATIGLAIVLFLMTFLFGQEVFGLGQLWTWPISLIALILTVGLAPLFSFLREFLGRRVLSRIKWK